jgi:hypothetical protein
MGEVVVVPQQCSAGSGGRGWEADVTADQHQGGRDDADPDEPEADQESAQGRGWMQRMNHGQRSVQALFALESRLRPALGPVVGDSLTP